ncbi:MAG: hypothetical protein LBF74_14090 [Treponema sp.]|jgi:hypothetical protein|nr:hypothetical protein [Treponema sp.]
MNTPPAAHGDPLSSPLAAPYKHRFMAPFQETGPGCTTLWVGAYMCLPLFMVGGMLQSGLSLGALAGFGLVGAYSHMH